MSVKCGTLYLGSLKIAISRYCIIFLCRPGHLALWLRAYLLLQRVLSFQHPHCTAFEDQYMTLTDDNICSYVAHTPCTSLKINLTKVQYNLQRKPSVLGCIFTKIWIFISDNYLIVIFVCNRMFSSL